MTKQSTAIQLQDVSKSYKLYAKNSDRLREAVHPLRKRYHHLFFALQNISLSIPAGETLGIIGRNGSGKSTLLKIITGVLTPSSGNLAVHGRISSLLELGTGFNPELTGIENIFYNGLINGYPRDVMAGKAAEIVDFAGIGEFINQPVKTYSSGMFVRLAFSVAIHVEPDILIIDEALSVGDASFAVKSLAKIRELRDSGSTLLFVSHDPGAVKALCNRAILLDHGKLIDEGTPDKVYDYYNYLIGNEAAAAVRSGSGHGDKDEKRKRFGNRKLELLKVEMINAAHVVADNFFAGEAVKLRITAKAYQAIENPTFGIMIRDRFGNDIFGINNALLRVGFPSLTAGEEYLVEYAFDLNLGEGIYSVSVASVLGENHIAETYDWINNCLAFTVHFGTGFRFAGVARLRADCRISRVP